MYIYVGAKDSKRFFFFSRAMQITGELTAKLES